MAHPHFIPKNEVVRNAGVVVRATPVYGLIGLLLALVTLLVYLPVRQYGFVFFDDTDYVTDNGVVQSGLTWTGMKWAFTTFHTSNWHPVTWLSHMLDVQLFGPGPAGPHLVNVLLHVANTVLLFVLLGRLTGALWRSTLVAALFALHPLHVESVAWVAERKDVLSAFFFLLTVLAYRSYVTHKAEGGLRYYLLSIVFFVLGLLSKPMLVTVPLVLLLLDYWPMHRFNNSTVRRLLLEKLPFFGLSAVSCVVTFVAQQQGGAVRSLASFPVGERLGNAAVSYGRYLGKTFWPVALAVPYPHPGHWPIGEVVMATVLVAGLCLVALWYGRRWPFMVTGWYWFLGMLIPVIGLVQVSNQAMADRYAYLPLTGVFIMVVWGVGEAVRRWRLPGLAAGVGAVVMVAACAGRTANQLEYWQNTESLFRHALAVTQGNFVAHNNLGNVLLAEGQVEEAIVQYRKALEMRPGYSDAHSNLGNALLQQGRIEEALARFQRALVLQPRDASVHNNFGNALLSVGRIQEAIVQYEEALDLQPDFAQAHNNLGWSLLQVGRLDEAISHLQRALALRPDYASAHNNLGYALLQKGKVREAIAECAAALKLEPYDTGTLSNLAWVLATWPEAAVRNGAEAMKLARRANQIAEGNDPVVLRALAAAQAESGQFTEAAATARQALQLVGAQSDVALADALKSQVTLYQSGMPFRDTGLTNGPPDRGQP